MKQAIFLPAVFLYLFTAAQQPAVSFTTNLPAYKPGKFDALKHLTSPLQSYNISSSAQFHSFSLNKPALPKFNFKPLQNYLSQDVSYFRIQQKQKEWTQFASASFSSWSKQNWMMNKNNVQQKWMMQKIKGK